MATQTKRQKMRAGMARPSRKRTPADRQKLGKDMIGRSTRPPELERVLLLLEPGELVWLNKMVAELKPERRRTSRNELIRLGISVLRDKDPDELRELLRNLA